MEIGAPRIARPSKRRLPVGAELHPDGGVHFRVWAPACREVAVRLDGQTPQPLSAEPHGYFSGRIQAARAGMQYRFQLDGDPGAGVPDPASRFQPDGPHGWSEIVDPAAFAWTDAAWQGVPRERLVIYEMHVGTLTLEGSWKAAEGELPGLADLGVTCVELMPVADFPGDFGWGYDGVNLFAPTRLYGRPDDFRRFVDRAHGAGIAVILDVVYNHLGPDGNYLKFLSPHYVSDRYANEWGEAINFDGPESGPVREFFIANAGYWIDEYHLDGLRLDATQQIFDASADHVIAAVARRVREAAGERRTFVVGENEPQHTRLLRSPEKGGYGLDALWNDDFHHSAIVALTDRREAYYSDYSGRAGELVGAAIHGFLFQGQLSRWQKQPRGTPSLDLPAESFVVFLQNHDQIANSMSGRRGHALASPGAWRAMTAYLLLMPGIPMLFQGQEFAASAPFLYFAQFGGDLRRAVAAGRGKFLAQFPSLASADTQALLADPADPEAFRRSKIDAAERGTHTEAYALHRDLLVLRRDDRVFGERPYQVEGAVLTDYAWVLRYFARDDRDRILIVNLGPELSLVPLPEPLLAPVAGRSWELLWSSEAPRYGGQGIPRPTADGVWQVPGGSALILATEELELHD
ncbi:MAG TPA: malto-oligosyltrehalose trehalohydrolase [Stellaceae bacterium]|nr:malto-oligosyltrehalose trehalohydrolase [Stellaceae bacterium]